MGVTVLVGVAVTVAVVMLVDDGGLAFAPVRVGDRGRGVIGAAAGRAH